MIFVAIVLLALLAAGNARLGKSMLYPPAVFCILWAALLAALALSSDVFYPLSLKGMGMVAAGAASLSLGGLVRVLVPHRPRPPRPDFSLRQARFTGRVLNAGLAAMIVVAPFYWRHLQGIRSASLYGDFWRGVREQTSTGVSGLGWYANFVGIASFLSLMSVYHDDGTRKARLRSMAVVGVTLAYHLVTGARFGALLTLFGLLAVSWLRRRRINWKLWSASILLFAVIFGLPAILLQKGGSVHQTLFENASGVLRSLQIYTLGGLVALDQTIDDPSLFTPRTSLRFFFALGRSLGLDVDVPSIVLPYTLTPTACNVYTIYGSYYADFGWTGVIAIMLLLGYVLTALYLGAARGRPESVILYGIAFAGLLMSCAGDTFLIALSYWIQAGAFIVFVYRWPAWTNSRRRSSSSFPAGFPRWAIAPAALKENL